MAHHQYYQCFCPRCGESTTHSVTSVDYRNNVASLRCNTWLTAAGCDGHEQNVSLSDLGEIVEVDYEAEGKKRRSSI